MSIENENGNFAKPMLSAGFFEELGFYETSPQDKKIRAFSEKQKKVPIFKDH